MKPDPKTVGPYLVMYMQGGIYLSSRNFRNTEDAEDFIARQGYASVLIYVKDDHLVLEDYT